MSAPGSAYTGQEILGCQVAVATTDIKARFYLDFLLRTNGNAFIGGCIIGSANYAKHISARRSAKKLVATPGVIVLFNDAGLNTLADASGSFKSLLYNDFSFDIILKSSFFAETTGFSVDWEIWNDNLITSGNIDLQALHGNIAAASQLLLETVKPDPFPSSSGKLLRFRINITNSEGTLQTSWKAGRLSYESVLLRNNLALPYSVMTEFDSQALGGTFNYITVFAPEFSIGTTVYTNAENTTPAPVGSYLFYPSEGQGFQKSIFYIGNGQGTITDVFDYPLVVTVRVSMYLQGYDIGDTRPQIRASILIDGTVFIAANKNIKVDGEFFYERSDGNGGVEAVYFNYFSLIIPPGSAEGFYLLGQEGREPDILVDGGVADITTIYPPETRFHHDGNIAILYHTYEIL